MGTGPTGAVLAIGGVIRGHTNVGEYNKKYKKYLCIRVFELF